MAYLRYRHDNFETYLFDRLRTSINIVLTLKYVSNEDHTIPEISKFLNSNPKFANKTSDAYAIVDRLETWNYVMRVRDVIKYKTKKEHFCITDKGKELLIVLPDYWKAIQELIDSVQLVL